VQGCGVGVQVVLSTEGLRWTGFPGDRPGRFAARARPSLRGLPLPWPRRAWRSRASPDPATASRAAGSLHLVGDGLVGRRILALRGRSRRSRQDSRGCARVVSFLSTLGMQGLARGRVPTLVITGAGLHGRLRRVRRRRRERHRCRSATAQARDPPDPGRQQPGLQTGCGTEHQGRSPAALQACAVFREASRVPGCAFTLARTCSGGVIHVHLRGFPPVSALK